MTPVDSKARETRANNDGRQRRSTRLVVNVGRQ